MHAVSVSFKRAVIVRSRFITQQVSLSLFSVEPNKLSDKEKKLLFNSNFHTEN